MDFFRKAADAVGGLILDSDSESDDERGTTTRRAGSSSNTSSKAKTTTHDDHWTDGDVARAASPDVGADGSFDDSDDEGDEKLIPDAVWGALAAARGKISEVASTVKRDVASAVEVVKHDLSEFNDRAVDETAAFAGDVAAAEYSTGLGLDDDDTDSDGGGARLDADVVDAFDNAVDALDDVGHKVEEFGVKMLGASKRFFHNLKEELTAEDDGSDGSDRDGDTRGFTSRVGLGAGGAAVAGGGLAARFASDRAAKSKNQSPNDSQNHNQNPKAPATRPPSLEQRVAAMQRDSATYCDEPEDLAGFERWTSGFDVDSPTVSAEVECVLEGNAFMAELQARIVPLVVTREEFWQRYFYALRRIKLEFGVEKEEEDKEAAAESGGDERKAEEEPEPEPEVEVEVEVEVEPEPEVEAEVEAEVEPVAEATPASEPPAHPRVATISAADSAEESGVTSDGSWAKVTSDGEVVEKTETKKKPAEKSEREGTVVAASPPDADLKAPAGDDDIDEDWGMDSD